jgi:hypothetical protein
MDFLSPIIDMVMKFVNGFLSIGKSSPAGEPPSDLVVNIQSLTVQFCGFLPMADSVIALLSVTFPGIAAPLSAAQQMARMICQAASTQKPTFIAADMTGISQQTATVTVNGVPVTGTWVKK